MLNQRKEYSRYYGGFRGVDFATDHTLVADSRFPYAVNMYKDYVSGAGQGIETIPGFRRRFEAPNGGHIYGIHSFKSTLGAQKVLVHAGSILYDWASYGRDEADTSGYVEMEFTATAIHTDMNAHDSVSFIFNNRLYILDGKNYLFYDGETLSNVKDKAYIPTTYINIIPAGENADIGTEYEQRNMLSPCFKHTFIADGENKVFVMNEQNLDAIVSVKVYGNELETNAYTVDLEKGEITLTEAPKKPEDKGYPEFYAGVEITAKKAVYEAKDVKIKRADGTETTLSAYRGDTANNFVSMIESATIATTFDNRVFFSGIPGKPNLVLYCGRNTTGYADPSYIGILNYVEDGVGTTPITAMLGVAGTLLVLKADTQQDGSVYYHTPTETGENILPKIYPSTAGLAGTGCIGATVNFLDDPVFISRLGLDAVSQLKIASERSIEHRSSLIDPKLLGTDLTKAKLCEWGGYLILLADGGKIFMADSRQLYQNSAGYTEYEWYYLEDIGVFEGQSEKYYFVDTYPALFLDENGERLSLPASYGGEDMECKLVTDIPEIDRPNISAALAIETAAMTISEDLSLNYVYAVLPDEDGAYHAFLCDGESEMVGGEFKAACALKTMQTEHGENVFFGTENGVVCSFNFDKKDNEGLIDKNYYTFDNRAIFSGVALKMDNCGSPNMVKSTKKRTTVIKTKNFFSTGAKIRVRTNRNPYREIAKINSKRFSFDDMMFSDFTFSVDGETIFSVTEKEKKWVEKQYFIYSDEFKKPFSMFYLIYGYVVIGKYKG
jgi:hypothetical protein